ncbi:adenylate kinase [archaeon]|nr:adenylate kinase [archaeon]
MIILGPQGCGKGTQAKKISKELDIPHISTGDIFRELRKEDSELGRKVKNLIDEGNFVPDDVTIEIVKDRLKKKDCKDGFILDGFPRNLFQAKSINEVINIDYVFDIEIPHDVSVHRLSGRRTCSNKGCGAIYNIYLEPKSKEERICDKCGSNLFQRMDDQKEAIEKRLRTYHTETEPMMEFYKLKSNLVVLDGTATIDEVFEEIMNAIL